jgi:splicing factor 3B subunit 3
MCAFQGRVLIGVGKLLRLYDLGKKKMLRKCENKVTKNLLFKVTQTFLNQQMMFFTC